MNGARWFLLVASSIVAFTAMARPLRADSTSGLTYRAVDGCPSEAQFGTAVAVRGGRVEGAESSVPPRRMEVSIRRDAGGFVGSFQVGDDLRTSAPREVHAASCDEVMEGLAVVTAIALQREAESAASNSPKAPSPPRLVPASAPLVPAIEAPSDQSYQHRLQGIGQFGKETVPVRAGPLAIDYALSVTASAGAVLGAIPSIALPRYDFTISRANFVTTPDIHNYLIGGILQVRWSLLGEGKYQTPEFSTHAAGFKAGVSACSALVYDLRGLVVLGCGEFAVGVMRLETKSAAGVTTQSKMPGVGTAGIGIESRYNLGSLVHLELRLGGELWLSNLTAERPDGSEIFRFSRLNGYAMAGVGLHF